jgi:hypothetical protein
LISRLPHSCQHYLAFQSSGSGKQKLGCACHDTVPVTQYERDKVQGPSAVIDSFKFGFDAVIFLGIPGSNLFRLLESEKSSPLCQTQSLCFGCSQLHGYSYLGNIMKSIRVMAFAIKGLLTPSATPISVYKWVPP